MPTAYTSKEVHTFQPCCHDCSASGHTEILAHMMHSATQTASMTQVLPYNTSRSVLKFDLTHLKAEI